MSAWEKRVPSTVNVYTHETPSQFWKKYFALKKGPSVAGLPAGQCQCYRYTYHLCHLFTALSECKGTEER